MRVHASSGMLHLLAFMSITTSAHAVKEVPAEAAIVISQVNKAAAARNVTALEQLMVPEFTWSFGADASAKQALAAWTRRPAAFRKLHEVTAKRCMLRADQGVECPRGAGAGYRAGFIHTAVGWRMDYFVAGD